MNISRRTVLLVMFSGLFFIASYVCGRESMFVEIKRDQEARKSSGFYVSDTPQEWNYWDGGAAGSFVIACSLLVAGDWLSRKN